MAANGGVDFGAGHAFLDVGIVGDRFESNVGNSLVHETLANVGRRARTVRR